MNHPARIGFIVSKAVGGAVIRNRTTREPFPDGFGTKVGRRALANGLLCRFDPDWIAFGPPLTVTPEQIAASLREAGGR